MGVVWYRLRADVRVRWRTLALIAVLVGVGGAVALTAFAGGPAHVGGDPADAGLQPPR